MSMRFRLGTAAMAISCFTAVSFAAPIPVLEFKFNGTGTTAENTGSLSSVTNAGMVNENNVATDLHSAPGGGVTGDTADRSFQNSFNGSTNLGGRVKLSETPSSLNGSTAITITGWYKTNYATIPQDHNQYLVDLGFSAGATAGVNIVFDTSNRLKFQLYSAVDGKSTLSTTETDFDDTQVWVFFAATYDSAVSGENNMKIYKGGAADSVALITGAELTHQAIAITPLKEFAIGNASGSNVSPVDGDMDNIRIFNSALTQEELEAVRASDVPEPATVAWVTTGLIGSLLFRRR